MCRKEIERSERESKKDRAIIEEYKIICRNHQCALEREKERFAGQMTAIAEAVSACETCSSAIAHLVDNNYGVDGVEGSASPQTASLHNSIDAVETNNASSKYRDTLLTRISDLEAELIKTKMALAEAEDRNGVSSRTFSISFSSNTVYPWTAFSGQTAQHQLRTEPNEGTGGRGSCSTVKHLAQQDALFHT